MYYSDKCFSNIKIICMVLCGIMLVFGLMTMFVFLRILQIGFAEGGVGTITGLITVILSALGGYNVYNEKKGMLIFYIVFVSLIYILQLAVGIYMYQERVKSHRMSWDWEKLNGIRLVLIVLASVFIHLIKTKKRVLREESEHLQMVEFVAK